MSSPIPSTLLSHTQIHSFLTSVLTSAGVSPSNASLISSYLVLADLRGVDTHGITRLPAYLARIQSGVLNPNPSLEFTSKSPVTAHLDAQHTFGFLAADTAIRKPLRWRGSTV